METIDDAKVGEGDDGRKIFDGAKAERRRDGKKGGGGAAWVKVELASAGVKGDVQAGPTNDGAGDVKV